MKSTYTNTTGLAMGLLIAASSLNGAILASWDFSNDTPSLNGNQVTSIADTVDSGVTASALTRGAGFTADGNVGFGSGRGAFSTQNGGQPSDLTAALSSTFYTAFSITPVGAAKLSLSSVDVSTFVQDVNGPGFSASLYFSTDGFTSSTQAGTISQVSSGWSGTITNIGLDSFPTLQDTSSPVAFRLYFYGTAGSWQDRGMGNQVAAGNDLQINGTALVPEPATYAAIAGLFILGLAYIRRRK
ncbi:MAG: PEP-CTERM sorting domain-containing protein [Verrucomicrobiota bacterium]|nr:PEP-CTERM sorting domain-containing protein [Verrucomicrobiota bacterium]